MPKKSNVGKFVIKAFFDNINMRKISKISFTAMKKVLSPNSEKNISKNAWKKKKGIMSRFVCKQD